MGVFYRYKPTSVFQTGQAVVGGRYEDSRPNIFRLGSEPAPAHDSWQTTSTPAPTRVGPSPQWAQDFGAAAITKPATQQAAKAASDAAASSQGVADAWAKWQGILNQPSTVDAGSLAYADAQYGLERQEMALRDAMLAGDVEEAQRLMGAIKAGRAQMAGAYSEYGRLVNPVLDDTVNRAAEIYPNAKPALQQIAQEEQGGIAGWFEEGAMDVRGEAKLIGADETAAAQAAGIVGEEYGLYQQQSVGRAEGIDKILRAVGLSAVEAQKATRAYDQWQKKNEADVTDLQYGQQERKQAEAIEQLEFTKQQFDLDRQRSKMAHDETLRQLKEGAEKPYMDAIGFGQLAGETALFDALSKQKVPLDRQMMLRDVMDQAFKQGVYTAKDFDAWLNFREGGDPSNPTVAESIGITGLSSAEITALRGAMSAYEQGVSKYDSMVISAPYQQRDKGVSYDNKVNAADARAGKGVYGARAKRVSALAPQILAQFDVKSLGQWRDLDAPVTKDRSKNSDHYAGGALDFSGSEAEMQRLKKYLETNAAKLGVKGKVLIHGNPRHVHVSFTL